MVPFVPRYRRVLRPVGELTARAGAPCRVGLDASPPHELISKLAHSKYRRTSRSSVCALTRVVRLHRYPQIKSGENGRQRVEPWISLSESVRYSVSLESPVFSARAAIPPTPALLPTVSTRAHLWPFGISRRRTARVVAVRIVGVAHVSDDAGAHNRPECDGRHGAGSA